MGFQFFRAINISYNGKETITMKNSFKDIKIDSTKVLGIAVTVLGVAGTLLSNKVEENKMKDLKNELKDEILKDIKKS